MWKGYQLFIIILLLFGNLLFNIEIKETRATSPYLFESGYETGDYSQWDRTYKSQGTLSIVSSPTHHGKYASKINVTGNFGSAVAIKYFSQNYTMLYTRCYVQFEELPPKNSYRNSYVISFMNRETRTLFCGVAVHNFGGTDWRWNIQYYNNGAFQYMSSSTTVTTYAWYALEMKCIVDNGTGEVKVWVNGDLIITVTNINNTEAGEGINCVNVGSGEGPAVSYTDCVIIDDTYIGLELGHEPRWRLTINSNPVLRMPVTVDGLPVGNTSTYLTVTEGTCTVTVPSGFEEYRFVSWEDGSTSPTRTLTITADMTITANYEIHRWQMTFNHKDIDNNNVDSVITWQLYSSAQVLTYKEGQHALLYGTYTLKTYYHGILINSTFLSTTTHGDTTTDILLQMKKHASVPNGYIAFNNAITSTIINSQTDSNLTFTISGFSPVTIIADVPRNATYVQRNGVNQTNWIYLGGTLSYIVILNASIDKDTIWEFYFPSPPPVVNKWQMTWNWRDLDDNDVSPLISWQLWSGDQQLKYTQGQYTLLDGTYILKTFLQGELINQTFLETMPYGNKTTVIKLQMKAQASVSVGYIAFNNIISSITINSQTSKNLTFTVSGSGAYKIIIKVPQNASYIQKDGMLQTGWTFDAKNNVIKISTPSLSTWTLIFTVEEPTPSTWSSTHLLILLSIVITIVVVLWALNRLGYLYL